MRTIINPPRRPMTYAGFWEGDPMNDPFVREDLQRRSQNLQRLRGELAGGMPSAGTAGTAGTTEADVMKYVEAFQISMIILHKRGRLGIRFKDKNAAARRLAKSVLDVNEDDTEALVDAFHATLTKIEKSKYYVEPAANV